MLFKLQIYEEAYWMYLFQPTQQVGCRTPQNNSESYILQREYPFAAKGVGI